MYAPEEYVEIELNDDMRGELEAKAIEYRCENSLSSKALFPEKCYIKKTAAEKVEDWRIRLYKTSIAATDEAAEVIVVVGVVILGFAIQAASQ